MTFKAYTIKFLKYDMEEISYDVKHEAHGHLRDLLQKVFVRECLTE